MVIPVPVSVVAAVLVEVVVVVLVVEEVVEVQPQPIVSSFGVVTPLLTHSPASASQPHSSRQMRAHVIL